MIYATAAVGFLYGAFSSPCYETADKLFDGLTTAAIAVLIYSLLSILF